MKRCTRCGNPCKACKKSRKNKTGATPLLCTRCGYTFYEEPVTKC